MSYDIVLYHPLVKTKSLYDKLSLDEFEHPKLTPEQISYFKTRLEAYEYQENDVVGNIAEYEKYFGKCIRRVQLLIGLKRKIPSEKIKNLCLKWKNV